MQCSRGATLDLHDAISISRLITYISTHIPLVPKFMKLVEIAMVHVVGSKKDWMKCKYHRFARNL